MDIGKALCPPPPSPPGRCRHLQHSSNSSSAGRQTSGHESCHVTLSGPLELWRPWQTKSAIWSFAIKLYGILLGPAVKGTKAQQRMELSWKAGGVITGGSAETLDVCKCVFLWCEVAGSCRRPHSAFIPAQLHLYLATSLTSAWVTRA